MSDLISREALKEHKILIPLCNVIGGRRCGKIAEQISKAYQKGWNDAIDAIIDNAPTVKPCDNCDLYFKAMTKEEMKKGGTV